MLAEPEQSDFGALLRQWRQRRSLTQRTLAERMAYHPSRVSQVESGALPHEDFARQADLVLDAGGELWALFQKVAPSPFDPPRPAEERELATTDFVAWLADNSTVEFARLYGSVCDAVARLENERPSARYGREHSRRNVTRERIADAAVGYYGSGGLFRAQVGGNDVRTSVATRSEWLTNPVDLRSDAEHVRYVPPTPPPLPRLDAGIVAAAVARLASVEVNGTVMVNNPLYRLLDIELAGGRLSAAVTTVPFAHHALTTQLMEGELVDAISAGGGPLPLRDMFLPDMGRVFDLEGRACAGGAASLLAVARREHGDYLLLTQERSQSVLGTTGKLAVIPKAFHQPTGGHADEVCVSSTVQREFEEELLGREDLEQLHMRRHAQVDLLHAQHRTEPMTWLLDQGHDAYRLECLGAGFNTVTGNYELACLIVVEDETWWDRFGHLVEANWEAERVHRHSTRDTAGIEALVSDPRWGNESLFAFVLGLHRLAAIGDPGRLALPTIDVEAT